MLPSRPTQGSGVQHGHPACPVPHPPYTATTTSPTHQTCGRVWPWRTRPRGWCATRRRVTAVRASGAAGPTRRCRRSSTRAPSASSPGCRPASKRSTRPTRRLIRGMPWLAKPPIGYNGSMSTPILATKLYIPPPPPRVVPRPRLIARLNAGLHRRLTLISAPAHRTAADGAAQ